MSSPHQRFMSSLSFKFNLDKKVDEFKVKHRLFSSRRFMYDILAGAIKRKIYSFQEVKNRYEANKIETELFVKGFMTYMGDNSNYPYGFYPEGIKEITNCYPDDEIWLVDLVCSGIRKDRSFYAQIKVVKWGNRAVELVEDDIEDHLCSINRNILLEYIDEEAIKDMEAHLIESDENDGYEEPEVGGKWFKCESCPICFEKLEDDDNQFIPKCGHPVCGDCKKNINKCPTCRASYVLKGNYYEEAKEFIVNEIEECIARGDNTKLKTLLYTRDIAERCIEEDGFGHSIGYEYEVDWGEEDEEYYWVLREDQEY